jgi:hypothetical protein
MFALIFGFTLLGVPLIVFVALNPTTIVVIAAFAVQLAACAIGVVWILRALLGRRATRRTTSRRGCATDRPQVIRPIARTQRTRLVAQSPAVQRSSQPPGVDPAASAANPTPGQPRASARASDE